MALTVAGGANRVASLKGSTFRSIAGYYRTTARRKTDGIVLECDCGVLREGFAATVEVRGCSAGDCSWHYYDTETTWMRGMQAYLRSL